MQDIHERVLLGLPPVEVGVAAGLARRVSCTTVDPPGSTGADKEFRDDQHAGPQEPHVALQLVLAGLKAGAKGYLLKDVTLAQLVGAIRTVADGGSLVQPAVTQRLLSGLEHMRNEFVSLDRPDPLTDLETEILRLMASGFSNKEIANSLGVAEGTIKNHVSNILSKLGVRDRTRAVLKAFELQLV